MFYSDFMLVLFHMYVRVFITRRSYSLSSHECAPIGQTEKMCFSLL